MHPTSTHNTSLQSRRLSIGSAAVTLLALLLLASAAVAHPPRPRLAFEDVSGQLSGDFFRSTLPFGGTGVAGLAWLDFDVDGDLDLYVTSGPLGNALYENDGAGHFTDVAAAAGAAAFGGVHVAVVAGDLDNDGYPDLVVLGDAIGPFGVANTVLHNRGDGTFEDVSAEAGIPAFPTSFASALLDYDHDGLLDVFVTAPGTVGMPEAFAPLDPEGSPIVWDARFDSSRLYRNLGGLHFVDVSAEAGVSKKTGGCAVAASDIDRDGDQDVIVANCNGITEGPVLGNCPPGLACPVCEGADDPGPCRPEGSGGNPFFTPFNVWRNNGDGTFTDLAEDPASGLGEILGAWMTVSPGDYDKDGDIDFFGTNVGIEIGAPHALVRNNGDGTFTDVAFEAGVAGPNFGWGGSFADFDLDSDLDLFYNGNLPGLSFGATGNPGRLYANTGRGTFRERSEALGVDLSSRFSSGAAAADFDNDGLVDLAVVAETLVFDENGVPIVPETPVLLRNRSRARAGWLTVRLVGTVSNAQGIGARIRVGRGHGRQIREVRAGSSYLSSETPWPTFAVQGHRTDVVIRWPSGARECFKGVATRQTAELVEGRGVHPRRCGRR